MVGLGLRTQQTAKTVFVFICCASVTLLKGQVSDDIIAIKPFEFRNGFLIFDVLGIRFFSTDQAHG